MLTRNPLRVYLLAAIYGTSLVLAAGLVAWIDTRLGILAVAWMTLVLTLALVRPFPFVEWIAAVVGILMLAAGHYVMQGAAIKIAPYVLIDGLGLAFIALSGMILHQRVGLGLRQYENDRKLIEELRVYDPGTDLLRGRYIEETLRRELARSQRYHKDLILLLIQPANWDELVANQGPEQAHALLAQAAQILKTTLRDVDIPFIEPERIGAILQETPPAGARIVAERLAKNITRKMRLPARVGVAHFPADAVTETELAAAAAAALQVALATAQPVVFYDQVRGAVESAAVPDGSDHKAASSPDEAMVAAVAAPAVGASAAAPNETRLALNGVTQMGETVQLEEQLQRLAGADKVQVVEYADGVLVLKVGMAPDALAAALPSALGVPAAAIQRQDGSLRVDLALTPMP